MILIFDNYDSFTYNIVHIVKALGFTVDVVRNDKIALDEVAKYDKIILSPGAGIPSEAGILLPLIEMYAASKSILGICLGEQAIGESFGAKLTNLATVFHGIESKITITANDSLFNGLSKTLQVGRYHSWVVSKEDFPETLEIIATDNEGEIMALRHKHYDIKGVQFHPESILTPQGMAIIKNWLNN